MKNYFSQSCKKRRGISQIIGTMMMVAIVAALGSVLLFQGMNATQSFNEYLSNFMGIRSDAAREEIIIEHVRFDNDSEQVDIWVRNIGIVDATINTVTIVKIDTQHLIVQRTNLLTDLPIKGVVQIPLTAADGVDLTYCDPACNPRWDDLEFSDNKEYFIAVTTIEGNAVEKVATTFNS